MRQLLCVLRACVYEACDGDTEVISDVVRRINTKFNKYYNPSDNSGSHTDNNDIDDEHGTVNAVNESLPQKERWIYPSSQNDQNAKISPSTFDINDSHDVDTDLHGSSNKNSSAMIARNSDAVQDLTDAHSTRDNESGNNDSATTLAMMRTESKNIPPEAMPDPFSETNGSSGTDTAKIIKTPITHPASVKQLNTSNSTSKLRDETVLMTFDEFKNGPGKALHCAYEDIRSAIRVEKERQRQITSMVNQRKAEIDALQLALHAYQKEQEEKAREDACVEVEMNRHTNSADDASAINSATVSPSSPISHQNSVDQVVSSMMERLSEIKGEYRAAYVELQLCKRQVADTIILKKRAMNDVILAYDKICDQKGSRQEIE